MRLLLETEGYEVEAMADSRGVENSLKGTDLVLLDVSLPFKNGIEVAREIKSSWETKDIPVVLISGVMDLENLARGSKADAFLEKPFDIAGLLKIVKKYTLKRHSPRH